ncbi:hypothetical protein KUCAC02_029289 [Chaenocephalus aceratus]|uniref:Uncharacterized protein n=1 Tax=Chaenocephalus aceratus TaxID=36190 RepID=A0ACB9X4C1_CHAAC|nr:hypothetical protein KUCAC02_029289 [Chaenocephalus aceratus]
MGMWIIALSAAPVRQTVRGSLGGVPQGSAIGLLEKAPPYRTPTPLGMARAASPAPFLPPTTIWTEQPILQYVSSKNNLLCSFSSHPRPTDDSTGGHQESGPGSKETWWGRPLMGTQPRGFSEEAEDPTLNANLETPETTHVIELLFLL